MTHDPGDMLSRSAAVDRVCALRERVLADHPTGTVRLDEIPGGTLAEDVVASADRPERSHATMDGYAFDATDSYPLALRETEVFPGDDPPSIDEGEAVRIFTGAPLPPEANAVLKQEAAVVEDDALHGESVSPGTYAYERGSNVRKGERLFADGERLSPKDALLLGDLGYDAVEVYDRFDVALLATGTEIYEGRRTDLDSPMLAGLVRSWGHDVTLEGAVPDDYDRVRERIVELADAYDVVVTTGGTSVGDEDHVVEALDGLGNLLFHRVRVRPGKPIAVAELTIGDAVVVAIPGKPVGAHVVATLVARPLFVGRTVESTVSAILETDLEIGPSGFEYVVPVELEDGTALPLGQEESALEVYGEVFDPSVLSSSTRATRADGFLIVEDDCSAGDEVAVVPYPVVE